MLTLLIHLSIDGATGQNLTLKPLRIAPSAGACARNAPGDHNHGAEADWLARLTSLSPDFLAYASGQAIAKGLTRELKSPQDGGCDQCIWEMSAS